MSWLRMIARERAPGLAMLFLWVAAPAALAADGVLEISQACAAGGGCFADDDPGYPVTISAPGSYRLTSNLFSAAEVEHIRITSAYVTLDLAGFEVAGPITCIGLPPGCTDVPAGRGIAVDDPGRHHVVVRNGTVRGTRSQGIALGERATIEDVHVDDIDGTGISAGSFSSVQRCTVVSTIFSGISLASTGRAVDNVVMSTGSSGLRCGDFCVLRGNTSSGSSGFAIESGDGAVVEGNAVSESTGGIQPGEGSLVRENAIIGNGPFAAINPGRGSLLVRNVIRGHSDRALVCPSGASPSNVRYGENLLTANNGSDDSVDADQGITDCLPLGANHCGTNLSCP